jgi:competence protein ComEA
MFFLRRWVRNIFGFSRSQTNGFMVLLPLMAVILFSYPVYHHWINRHTENFAAERAKLDSLMAQWGEKKTHAHTAAGASKVVKTRFAFDPNKAPVEALQSLGFSERLSIRVAHYREKGGKFRVKADLLKIYGMDSSFYQQLYPYIELPEKLKKEKQFKNSVSNVINREKKAVVKVDLNLADTSQLKRIYGIGEKLSLRIIRYRSGLGGFTALGQLKEVYGLDSAVVNRLTKAFFIEAGFVPRQININEASAQELSIHPYLSKSIASAIVAYRFQHGNFSSPEELEKIQLLNAETIQKITPYLRFE